MKPKWLTCKWNSTSGNSIGRVLFQIVQRDAGEIGNDHVLRDFVAAAFARQILDVVHRLGVGLAEVFAAALVLGEQDRLPEEVDEAVVAAEVLDRFLEAGHVAAGEAEDLEELVPERLRLGVLARFGGPFAGKREGAAADFVPGNGHGERPPNVTSAMPTFRCIKPT